MDERYLEELIEEAKRRGGGFVLSLGEMPAAVVMTVEKYNELIINHNMPKTQTRGDEQAFHSNNNKKILVTGGAGYIGAHTCRELLKAGYEVVVIDNLSTGKRQNVPEGGRLVEGDIADTNLLRDLFASEHFYAVMHFAASIEVEESVSEPVRYLQNNTLNTANLLAVMKDFNVNRFIFSSTAAVYGEQEVNPINEHAKLQPNNPYGYSKLLSERIIKYYCHFINFQAIIFRYFNACGCDFDGAIKPTHHSHLMPIVMEVAMGQKPALKVYGNDYPTKDGTAVRDYVHVLDIARAHVVALEHMDGVENYRIFNIGTGNGSTVLEVVEKAREVLHKDIPIELVGRRAGDAAATVADNKKIREELGFNLEFSDTETIVKTTWHQMNHK